MNEYSLPLNCPNCKGKGFLTIYDIESRFWSQFYMHYPTGKMRCDKCSGSGGKLEELELARSVNE